MADHQQVARRHCRTSSRPLSAVGLLSLAKTINAARNWETIAKRLGFNHPDAIRYLASDVGRSEEVELLTQWNCRPGSNLEDLIEAMQNVGLQCDIINDRRRRQRIVQLHCQVYRAGQIHSTFKVEALACATLKDCLSEFCNDHQITTDDLCVEVDGAQNCLNRRASDLLNKSIAIHLRNTVNTDSTPEMTLSQPELRKRSRSPGPSRKPTELSVHSGASSPVSIRTNRQVKIYFITHSQVGDGNKIIGCLPPTSDTDSDDDMMDDTHDDSSSDDYSDDNKGQPLSPHKARGPLRLWKHNTLPVEDDGLYETPVSHSPSLDNISSQSNHSMSDVELPPHGVASWENIRFQPVVHKIPKEVIYSAYKTEGFWDLRGEKAIAETINKFKDKFAGKNGRFIVWRDLNNERFVASVTYNGEVRHFQIIWNGRALEVVNRYINAPDLSSLLKQLRHIRLKMQHSTDSVTLRSAVKCVEPTRQRVQNNNNLVQNHRQPAQMAPGQIFRTFNEGAVNGRQRRGQVEQSRCSYEDMSGCSKPVYYYTEETEETFL